jgi:transposase
VSNRRIVDPITALALRSLGRTYSSIADEFGVSAGTVHRAVKRHKDPAWARDWQDRHNAWLRRSRAKKVAT